MMKNIFFKAFIVFSLVSSVTIAQEIKGGEVSNTDQDKFITLSQINNITLNAPADVPNSSISAGVNSVFIQQIGTSNQVFSNVTAESSDIKIFQNGNDNNIEINESARLIEKTITQSGNNNSVVDFSVNPDISTNLELIQEGNNLNFERFGSNELSKNLKFKMSGNARTVIVRSF